MKAIADTGFLVAFLNRSDRYHAWGLEIAAQVDEPLLTCDAVLAEAAFHTRDACKVLALVRDGLIVPEFSVQKELPRLEHLARRYADRQPDLADLCVIRLAELHPKYNVITVDVSDFRIYRRNQRETIPLIHPPGL